MSQGIPTDEKLLEMGRAFANDVLRQLTENTKTPEQLNGQLHIGNCMAVHIIATNMFNRLNAFPELSRDELIEELVTSMNEELNLITLELRQ